MTKETRYLYTEDLRVEQSEDAKPKIVGYAAVFNSLSHDLGGFRETISPGAFTRTIRDGADVRALVDHNPTLILGRNKSGTLTLKPNQKGLLVEIDPPDTQAARDIIESMRRGDVDGMSFAFRTVHDDWHIEDSTPIRELLDVELLDVSVVTYPAYPATEVAVRSMQDFLGGRSTKTHAIDSSTLRRKLQLSSM